MKVVTPVLSGGTAVGQAYAPVTAAQRRRAPRRSAGIA